jgi:hypothetical protein
MNNFCKDVSEYVRSELFSLGRWMYIRKRFVYLRCFQYRGLYSAEY